MRSPTTERSSGRRRAKALSARGKKVLQLLPGYDPFADCGDFIFDVKEAERACEFFPRFLKHMKGPKAGQPFELEPWQQAVIGNLFGWRDTRGRRRYHEALIFVPRKNGKALSLQTPLPTPSGWTTMGEVHVGDELFDENGLPCRVIHTTEIMHGHACLEVEFADGETIVADADHQWLTQTRSPENGESVYTTAQIAETLHYGARGDRNHRIPVAGALHLPDADLPIDPYQLGVWLGDGTSSGPQLTLNKDDAPRIISEIADPAWVIRDERGCQAVRVSRRQGQKNMFLEQLRAEDLLHNKGIPPHYLRASYSQRLALLQGLMDTDGSCAVRGQCEFSTTSPLLCRGVRELLATLGIKATVKSGRAMLSGKDCGPNYRIQFFAFKDTPVFRVDRKRLRQKLRPEKSARSTTRTIKDVRPVPSVPVRCIQVDSPSRLYLCGRGMIPTHNTILAAGIANYVFFCDGEPGAEIYCVASDEDQAALLFDLAKRQALSNRTLEREVHSFRRAMELPDLGSVFRPLSSVAETKHGLNPYMAVFDEVHTYPHSQMIDVISSGMGARVQPLRVYITTSDYDRPDSTCNKIHDYASGVRDKRISDPRFLPAIYQADEKDDWTDPVIWAKANPNLGVSISQEFLEDECRKALAMPTEENKFKRLYLNIRTGQEIRWLPMHDWKDCFGEDLGFLEGTAADGHEWYSRLEEHLAGEKCWAGLDLSSTQDITAFVLVFPRKRDGRTHYYVIPYFWVPRKTAKMRQEKDDVFYVTWGSQGWVQITDGNAVDYENVRRRINELGTTFGIQEIALDPREGQHLYQMLDADGFSPVMHPQSFKEMSPPSKELEKAVLEHRVAHGGHQVLYWMAQNVAVRKDDDDNIRPFKKGSGEKIDGIVALVMGISRAMLSTKRRSVYEKKRLFSF